VPEGISGRASSACPGRNANQASLPQRPAQEAQLPFVLELKASPQNEDGADLQRPDGDQVFDGANAGN